jgi:hypothetical protein
VLTEIPRCAPRKFSTFKSPGQVKIPGSVPNSKSPDLQPYRGGKDPAEAYYLCQCVCASVETEDTMDTLRPERTPPGIYNATSTQLDTDRLMRRSQAPHSRNLRETREQTPTLLEPTPFPLFRTPVSRPPATRRLHMLLLQPLWPSIDSARVRRSSSPIRASPAAFR